MRPVATQRLACVVEAFASLQAGGVLDPGQRAAAVEAAHKLAGSLGMYGYPEGSRACRDAELTLEAPGRAMPPIGRTLAALRALAAELSGTGDQLA